jgi:hypothetical protein
MRFTLALIFAASLMNAATPFEGRWDLTITTDKENYPGWFELDGAGKARVQPRTGSVVDANSAKVDGNHLQVVFGRSNITWDLTADHGKLTGTQKNGEAVAQVEGVRAPVLDRKAPTGWSSAEPLFDGKDIAGWEPTDPANTHWVAQDGILVNLEHGANLRTTRKFQDFKLHIELNCPQDGNSGIYLRGRYEVQVAYEKAPDKFHSMAAIYGFLAPSMEMPRKPGQWEALDITLVGRRILLVRDGTTLLDNLEIPGITGGALDSHETEPGVFYIQGDHTGGMKYRNITISVPKR